MKKIVIIGGGIAGISAGIFAQKNGFKSVILEKHHTPGGECAGWDRKGYHVDGCIHWLMGTKEGTALNALWKETGALAGVDIYHPDTFMTVEHETGTVPFHRDLEKLKTAWLALSPEDAKEILAFCSILKKLHSFEVPVDRPMDLMTFPEKVKLLWKMKDVGAVMQKYGKVCIKDYANRFNHPALREALASFLPKGYSVSSIFFSLGAFTNGQASLPYGGSKAFSQRMADRYKALGGTLITSCEAEELLKADDHVQGVRCQNGAVYQADYVVAACDPKVLYAKLLKNEYNDAAFEDRYANPDDYPLSSEIRIAIGFKGNTGELPHTVRFPVTPFKIHDQDIRQVTMTHYHHDPSFAPEGHTLITCSINQFAEDYDAWHQLSENREAYGEEKERIGQRVINAIEKRFPSMSGKLMLLDVTTPKTYERYCNAHRGAFMGFLPTVKGKMLDHSGRIKGLNNVLLSGQWLQPPGGLPVALITGKDTIMRICKQEGHTDFIR